MHSQSPQRKYRCFHPKQALEGPLGEGEIHATPGKVSFWGDSEETKAPSRHFLGPPCGVVIQRHTKRSAPLPRPRNDRQKGQRIKSTPRVLSSKGLAKRRQNWRRRLINVSLFFFWVGEQWRTDQVSPPPEPSRAGSTLNRTQL